MFQNIELPSIEEVYDATCIAIDFETANSNRASPCSIGVTWLDDIRILRTAHRLIRPWGMNFDGMNISIHGIHPEDVEFEPEFPEVWQELLEHFSGKIILAHNASFDMRVLRKTSSGCCPAWVFGWWRSTWIFVALRTSTCRLFWVRCGLSGRLCCR